MKFLSNPLLWFILAITLFFMGSGAVGFVGPDEPRYADVARAMLRSGDYITPRLNGTPWFEKPPLYYWLAALFFRLGINEVDARLPSALSACAFVGLWFWFSRRIFGMRTAVLACILLASTVGWVAFAHAAVMDMLLSATLGAALVFLSLWFWENNESHLYGFYALLGLATLAKGPVAVGLAGLIALAYVATFKEWKSLGRLLFSPAIGVFAVVAAPWYALCYARNGYPFIQDFFLKHNLGRYISPELGHGQPVWYYVPILAAGLFPWTPLLLLPLLEIFRMRPQQLLRNRQKMFLLYWTALPFVFFSFAQNKLPGYLLPILPPLTLWIAQIVEPKKGEGVKEDESDGADVNVRHGALMQKTALWLIGISAVLLLLIPVLAFALQDAFGVGVRRALMEISASRLWAAVWRGPVPRAAYLAPLVPVGLSIYMLWRRNLLEAAFMVTAGVALCMVGIVQYLSPSIDRLASVRNVAQRIQLLGVDGENLAVFHLARTQSLGLNFYMEHALPEWLPEKNADAINYVIARDDDRLPDTASRVFFPPQHLRLWALTPTEFQIELDNKPDAKVK